MLVGLGHGTVAQTHFYFYQCWAGKAALVRWGRLHELGVVGFLARWGKARVEGVKDDSTGPP